MKKLYLLAIGLLAAGLVLSTACDGGNGGPLNLTYTITDNGGSVSLTWDAVEGADAYSVTVDGTLLTDTITGTSYKVTEANAGKKITVAVVDDATNESSVEFDMVLSSSVKTWSKQDPSPDHPSWVKFDASGNATAVSSTEKASAAWYMNSGGGEAWLATNWTGANPPGHNPTLDVGFNVETGPIGSIKVAPAPGGYFQDYPHGSSLGSNQFGTFWLDASADNAIGEGDHFGKFTVTNYNPNDGGYPSATCNIYYQSEPKLRWVVD